MANKHYINIIDMLSVWEEWFDHLFHDVLQLFQLSFHVAK